MFQEIPSPPLPQERPLSPDQMTYRDAIDEEICAGCYFESRVKKPVNITDADANRGCCNFSCYEKNIQHKNGLDYQAIKAIVNHKRRTENKPPVGGFNVHISEEHMDENNDHKQFKEAA